MTVDIYLATEKGKGKAPDYHSMKLLFLRGVNKEEDHDGSRKDWALFLSYFTHSVNIFMRQLGCTVETIMSAIDTRVEEFFVLSLQLDALTMELEYE